MHQNNDDNDSDEISIPKTKKRRSSKFLFLFYKFQLIYQITYHLNVLYLFLAMLKHIRCISYFNQSLFFRKLSLAGKIVSDKPYIALKRTF